ncbi:MAG: hypothetical protein V2A34_13210 [Lentisphaerota bacterium]
MTTDGQSRGDLKAVESPSGPALQLQYALRTEDHGFVQLKKIIEPQPADETPVTFLLKAQAASDLEVKFVSRNGSIFWVKWPLSSRFPEWTRITLRQSDLDYGWGGNGRYDGMAEFHVAVSGQGTGTVWLADIGLSEPEEPSTITRDAAKRNDPGLIYVRRNTPQLDPQCDQPGLGFEQRRAEMMTPEDPLVLEWLKTMQDVSSPGRQVLPTTEDNELQTFNNALVAIAFILKGEQERAERILDFFATATARDNQDRTLQNFFYKGEARGFYQAVALKTQDGIQALHSPDRDRWMGDMAWLLLAYTYHEQTYSGGRYKEITQLLHELLVAWFIDSPRLPGGGYVQHGWRKGDIRLHEDNGHPEGNIDCYAVFTLIGETEKALKIRTWLEAEVTGDSQPLDLYTWRVLAYNGARGDLLKIPDCDLRYRKTVTVNGRKATGPYHSAEPDVNNIWLDGLGHLACAFFAAGDPQRGAFYANQFDAFLMDSTLGGKHTRTLPYTANGEGGFNFDQSKGYISVAAWYIFAKNAFNPMMLKKCGS